MRLWHKDLIKVLPRQQLLGQRPIKTNLNININKMKIYTIRQLFKNLPLLLENMSLGEVKKRIKNNTLKVAPGDKKWYGDESNRKELIDVITQFNTSKNLKNFNTEPYFLDKKFLPTKLLSALEQRLGSEESRSELIEDKDAYGVISLPNNIKIYAPYTLQANIKLAYRGVVKGRDPYPTWCIASPTSGAQMWSYYHLWDTEAPIIFLIVKEGITENALLYDKSKKQYRGRAHNLRYELLGSPNKDVINRFLKGEVTLKNFIREWRNATQEEGTVQNTTLFENLDITENELAQCIRKLMMEAIANGFSEKYGKKYIKNAVAILASPNVSKQKRLSTLATLSRIGSCNIDQVLYYIQPDEVDFVVKECFKAKTLTADILLELGNKKISPEVIVEILLARPDFIYLSMSTDNLSDDDAVSLLYRYCKNTTLSSGENAILHFIQHLPSLFDVQPFLELSITTAPKFLDAINKKIIELAVAGAAADNADALDSILGQYYNQIDTSNNKRLVLSSFKNFIFELLAHDKVRNASLIWPLKLFLENRKYNEAAKIYNIIANDKSIDNLRMLQNILSDTVDFELFFKTRHLGPVINGILAILHKCPQKISAEMKSLIYAIISSIDNLSDQKEQEDLIFRLIKFLKSQKLSTAYWGQDQAFITSIIAHIIKCYYVNISGNNLENLIRTLVAEKILTNKNSAAVITSPIMLGDEVTDESREIVKETIDIFYKLALFRTLTTPEKQTIYELVSSLYDDEFTKQVKTMLGL